MTSDCRINVDILEGWCKEHIRRFYITRPGEEGRGICPFHNDRDPSLSVYLRQAMFYCFACKRSWSYPAFCSSAGLPSLGNARYKKLYRKGLVPSYTYCLADGTPALQVRRYKTPDGGKAFPVFHYEPPGRWVAGKGSYRNLLYNLPTLSRTNGADVLFVEGEKDAEAAMALGFIATTKLGGACKPEQIREHIHHLEGNTVWIIPDNDQVGYNYASELMVVLYRAGITCHLLPLDVYKPGGDLSDWIERIKEEGAGNPAYLLRQHIHQRRDYLDSRGLLIPPNPLAELDCAFEDCPFFNCNEDTEYNDDKEVDYDDYSVQ